MGKDLFIYLFLIAVLVAGGKRNKQNSTRRNSAGIAVVIVLAAVYLTTRSICRSVPFFCVCAGTPARTANAEKGKQLGKCFRQPS